MLAFIVGNKTLNDVATLWLKLERKFNPEFTTDPQKVIEKGTEIKRALYQVNCESVDYRYRETSPEYAIEAIDAINNVEPFGVSLQSYPQLVKSYFCWNDQSCEDDNSETYNEFRTFFEDLMDDAEIIKIRNSVEYDAGYWGD